MLQKIALVFGGLKALEWVGKQFSNGITITALPVKRSDVKLFDEKLLLRLVFTNNNPVPITINSVKGTFSQAGQTLKSINMQDVIKVDGGKSKTLLFGMDLDLDTTLFNLANAIEKGNLLAPIEFQGRVKVMGLNLRVNLKFEILNRS